MTFEPEIEDAIRAFTENLGECAPNILKALMDAKDSGASELEVMQQIMHLVANNPGVVKEIEQAALVAFAPTRPIDSEVVLPPRQPGGVPRINPLYSAALQERIQFDGDVPELRTGPLPLGVAPAVPVATDARSAVVLGKMLQEASKEVAAELHAIEARVVSELSETTNNSLTSSDPAFLAKIDRANLPDPIGYVRGQAPDLRPLGTPSGSDLVALSPEQRGQLAWKFLSTTQGRRTATQAIRSLVIAGLQSDGFKVVSHDKDPLPLVGDAVLAYGDWVVDLAGPASTQSGFAFVDTAAQVLILKLEKDLELRAPTTDHLLLLEVIPINTVDVRRVGWAARISIQSPQNPS